MDKDWLVNRINEGAERCFVENFENLTTNDSAVNQLFLAVKQTPGWSKYRTKMIKEIEQNLFYKLEGLKELVEESGDI